MSNDSEDAAIADTIKQLRSPIPDVTTLLALLCGPLSALGLLPPQFRRYDAQPLPEGSVSLRRHIPLLQQAILEHIFPTWDSALEAISAISLLEQYFCPDTFSFALEAAGEVSLLAYSTILSQRLVDYAIRMLVRLSVEYPIDRLHTAVFRSKNSLQKQNVAWEDCVRNVVAVPNKVANAVGLQDIPTALELGPYFDNLCKRCECLIASLADDTSSGM
jgi:telomere length regulation protein